MSSLSATQGWVVLLAVKRLQLAKSRLDRADRQALTVAMAVDTAAAATSADAVAAVVVVTDDPDARAALTQFAVVIPDVPDAGLNPALTYAAAEASRQWPGHPVAVLAADLPALRPAALARALSAAQRHPRSVVADAGATGTVLLTAATGTSLSPAFGPGSRERHAAHAIDLTAVLPDDDETGGLRQDVDTAADLERAIRIGVGPATARVLSGASKLTQEWHTSAVSNSRVPSPNPGRRA
jgi:2-phospho-L-lactate guanylyltransferase